VHPHLHLQLFKSTFPGMGDKTAEGGTVNYITVGEGISQNQDEVLEFRSLNNM